ncbi:hypothetical protein H8356DRAFT_1664564 [Neocallimastix lanati (nom. inval.)]|jgi:hypothetical protein|uniref:Protein EFR3 n=1 Tax=Neocallimastix californiae TaxID=1754190 RepID=A0A1Y2DYQ7_9FUNG|nr:hypothetical protein H8356DRAFT_1664564 [Neocallimastix sp. JGI-2020a]ORY63775.1 hypothetical protein LY90DRAFT_505227 [Neocallimastix californiae]|eukprot:ORY63775.1 hypothetical protein LY90DRAFT_505227 [Neocallimastix californiae]
MSRYSNSQFDIQNLEIYKEDAYNTRNKNQEKINYSIYKSKSSEFDRNRRNNSLEINIGNNTLAPPKAKSETSSVIDVSDSASITSSNITTSSDKFAKTKKLQQKSNRGNFFSLYDIIDPSMCFQSCYNHASLVNNVYPKGPGEEGAKSNNLSFLMFYAKSRPQKLIKIGNYLEKKAKRDIWNSRPDLVKVTLTILDSLINTCPQHMNLISKNAVNIFYEILVSNLDLLTEVTNTFMNFSSKHDHITLDIDESFHAKYLQVLEQFCKCCRFEDSNEQKRNETRLNGLKALHSVAASNSFLISPRIDSYLIIIQPLVENILISKISSNVNINNADEVEAHTLNKDNVSSDVLELENYSLKSISEIMQKVTPATFEKIINPIYSYINDKDQWSYLHYLTKILKIAMDSIQNQYRYLLITSLFKRLNDTESNKNDIKIQTNIIFVLTFVITSNERSIGLTCLELLDNLTKHILISLKNKNNPQEDIEVFQSAVVDCIGSLARNIFYPEQTNDMLSFLINRLCFNGTDHNSKNNSEKKSFSTISNTSIKDLGEYLNEEDIIKYRIIIFHCLRRVIENRKVSDLNASINQTPISIPIELLTPTVRFLLTDSIEQKIEYFNFMASVIPYISTSNNSRIAIINHNKMIKEYHLVIHDYLNKNNLKIIDYILIYNTLVVTLNQFLDEETFISIPIIDKLQQMKKEGVCVEEQIVYQTVLLKYIENIVQLLKNDSLQQYIKELKDERKNNGHWVELNYELKDIYGYKNKSFKDLNISPNATPVTEFMDYKKINEYTNFDEELYRQYPELKEKGSDISFKDILEIVTDNKNYKKTNSITLDSKHIKLANINIPQLESKIPDYINIDELKNTLDLNVKNDHKLEDFSVEGYSSNNILSSEVNNLLNEIAMVNTPTSHIKNDSSSDEPSLDSPSKSIITQSTGNATMVNYSPTKSNFSRTSDNNSNDINKDLFRINDYENILPTTEMIQQQTLAYPKMEMNNLMIPNHSDSRTQSIYIKEPALR